MTSCYHEMNTTPTVRWLPGRVVNLFQNYSPLLDVYVGGYVIRTTAEHPFWVVSKGWTDAHQIVIGDLLLGINGERTAVEAIDGPKESAPVYNVEVEEYHTYLVGSTVWGFAVWAHNNCFRTLVDSALGSTAQATRLEGKVGNHLFDRLTAFQKQVPGLDGNILGEIDVAVPEAIIEVTIGNKGKVDQVTKLLTSTVMNPTGLPVILFAPNFKKNAMQSVQNIGAGAYVVRSLDELDALLLKLRGG